MHWHIEKSSEKIYVKFLLKKMLSIIRISRYVVGVEIATPTVISNINIVINFNLTFGTTKIIVILAKFPKSFCIQGSINDCGL